MTDRRRGRGRVGLDLDEVYDADTLAALDAGAEPQRPPAVGAGEVLGGWRRAFVGGSIVTGLALGMGEVFDPDINREPVFEPAPDPGLEPVGRVTLFFVPGNPQATVAVVRRFA